MRPIVGTWYDYTEFDTLIDTVDFIRPMSASEIERHYRCESAEQVQGLLEDGERVPLLSTRVKAPRSELLGASFREYVPKTFTLSYRTSSSSVE